MVLIADSLKKLLFGRAFKASDGTISIFNRLYVSLYETSALAMTVEEIYKLVKTESKAVNFWHKIGAQVIKEGIQSFNIKSAKGHLNILRTNLNFTDFFGWGKFKIENANWTLKNFRVSLMLEDSPLLKYGNDLYGSKSHTYTFLLGIFSGIFSEFLGRKAKVKLLDKYSRDSPYMLFEVK